MRCQRYVSLLILFTLLSACLFAQGLNTTASKDDWEEINFEFNSHSSDRWLSESAAPGRVAAEASGLQSQD